MQRDVPTCAHAPKVECESVKRTVYMADYGPPVRPHFVFFSHLFNINSRKCIQNKVMSKCAKNHVNVSTCFEDMDSQR